MSDSRPSAFWIVLLLLGLIVLAAGGTIAFLPVVECSLDPYLVYTNVQCPFCHGRGRRALLDRWRFGPSLQPHWEHRTIEGILGVGFVDSNYQRSLSLAGIRTGETITNASRIASAQALLATGYYTSVSVLVEPYPSNPARNLVTVSVVERPGLTLPK